MPRIEVRCAHCYEVVAVSRKEYEAWPFQPGDLVRSKDFTWPDGSDIEPGSTVRHGHTKARHFGVFGNEIHRIV